MTYCPPYIHNENKRNNKLKETNIKNRTCCYFDDIIKFEDFDLDNIFMEENSYENILVYNIP